MYTNYIHGFCLQSKWDILNAQCTFQLVWLNCKMNNNDQKDKGIAYLSAGLHVRVWLSYHLCKTTTNNGAICNIVNFRKSTNVNKTLFQCLFRCYCLWKHGWFNTANSITTEGGFCLQIRYFVHNSYEQNLHSLISTKRYL